VEIIIAGVMALLVSILVIRVLFFMSDIERTTSASYLIRQEVEVAFRRLQDDLRMTSLSTIRVERGDQGFSCASPLEHADRGSFEISQYGVARWKSWVHYTVVPQGQYVGNLVRWESKSPEEELEPRPSPFKPSEIQGDFKSTLLPNVLQPGVGLIAPKKAGELEQVGAVPNEQGGGGLRVRFLRRERNNEDTLSDLNPAQANDDVHENWSFGTTELVDCQLTVGDLSKSSGRWSVHTLAFRVSPRN
jgi:hypothetical protein